jgi:hypothetical protein
MRIAVTLSRKIRGVPWGFQAMRTRVINYFLPSQNVDKRRSGSRIFAHITLDGINAVGGDHIFWSFGLTIKKLTTFGNRLDL